MLLPNSTEILSTPVEMHLVRHITRNCALTPQSPELSVLVGLILQLPETRKSRAGISQR